MPCAVCAYDPRVLDLAIRDFIDFELLRMAKVLKYITVFVCYCDLHGKSPFSCFLLSGFIYQSRSSPKRSCSGSSSVFRNAFTDRDISREKSELYFLSQNLRIQES